MSFMDEKLVIMKVDRSLALNSKVQTEQARDAARDEDVNTKVFLFGDTQNTNIGILDLFKLYYEEKMHERGTYFTWPNLANLGDTWGNSWLSILLAATSVYGDRVDGFFPPDAYGVGAADINLSSYYLTDNNETVPGSGGLIALANTIITSIGDSASAVGDSRHVSGFDYGSSAAARVVGESLAAGDSGSGLLGKRSSNSEVDVIEGPDPGGDSYYQYVVGKNGPDNPNYYGTKTAFVNSINALKVRLYDGDSYRIKLDEIITEISKIDGDSNEVFNEGNMTTYVFGGDTTYINAHKANIDSYLGDSGDTAPGDTNFWGYYTYFNEADGSEGGFDARLVSFENLLNGFKTFIGNRHTQIGDSALGLSINDTNLLKIRAFWVKQIVGKPISTLVNYVGLNYAITIAEKRVYEKDEALNFILNDPDVYIPKPEFFAVYYDPKLNDLTGTITLERISLTWGGQQHVTKYYVYRKSTAITELNNTAWGDTYLVEEITEIDEETDFVETFYYNGDSAIQSGTKFVYRVKCEDTTGDTFTSSSEQSDVLDTRVGDSFISITHAEDGSYSVLDFNHEHVFRKGQYLILLSNTKPEAKGFYEITRKVNNTVRVSPKVPIVSSDSGLVYVCNSVVFVS